MSFMLSLTNKPFYQKSLTEREGSVPLTNQFRLTAFDNANIIYFLQNKLS